MAQCTRLDPGAALRPQTAQSFDCLDAASPSRSHSSAFLRSISRAKGPSVFSAAWRQSLAWCSHNSTCDDIAPTSCGQLMQTRTQWRSPGWLCVANVHSYVQSRLYGLPVMIADGSVPCGFIVLAFIIPSKTSMCTL